MHLKCHCENIQITVSEAPETLTSCNCSICNRYGALWGYYSPDQVSISIGAHGAKKYSWGDKCIDFVRCNNCGCLTHYESTEKVAEPKIAGNFRMVLPSEIENISIRKFDAADTWTYLT